MRGRSLTIGLLLFVTVLAVFGPLRHAGFVNYDDPAYVYDNPHVTQGVTWGGVQWALATFDSANWHPLTWLSHMLDVEVFGLDPGAHHGVSVFLHALNAVLLFSFLVRATRAPWPSAFAAALFAVHPLHVESVAWISERKDVLSTFFWLLALHAYLGWVGRHRAAWYGSVLALLVAGLAAKPMVVTLPFVLLLLDLWPLGRTRWAPPAAGGESTAVPLARLVGEKLPLFAVVAAACVVTLAAQRAGGAVVGVRELPMSARLMNAVGAYVWYLEKAVWPTGLAVFYPHSYAGAGSAGYGWWGSLGVLLGATALVLWQSTRRPYLLVGWLWYLGTLVPVIGLVQVGIQAAADRYSYVPLIGPFVAIAFAAAEVAAKAGWRRVTVTLAAAASLLACVAVTRSQIPYWQGARALATRAIVVSPSSFTMHFNLAVALEGEGDLTGARRHYEEAIRIQPSLADAYRNLAVLLAEMGEPAEALRVHRAAIRAVPGDVGLVNNLAWLLATSADAAVRDGAQARALAEEAVRRTGGRDAQTLDTLAAAQAEAGDFEGAVSTAARAARRAREEGQGGLAGRIERHARSYALGRPYRDRPR